MNPYEGRNAVFDAEANRKMIESLKKQKHYVPPPAGALGRVY